MRLFRWLGIEANARAIGALLLIGGALASVLIYVAENISPRLSPGFSSTEFGEGYRRGRKEAELEFRLKAANQTIEAMQSRAGIHERISRMNEAELDAELQKWARD